MVREPAALLADYARDGAAPRWAVDPDLLASATDSTRDRSTGTLTNEALTQVAWANGSLLPADMRRLVDAATRHLLDRPLSGTGVELGAGVGALSATVATRPEVHGVLAVEVRPVFVDEVIPQVARDVLGADAAKVVPVHGSFDHLEVPDASLDFAVEIGSLHHADDLDAVLAETARVLRPGAPVVAFDRVQPDDMPDWLRERMLDHQYDDDFLERVGLPRGLVITRRESGEHEIRWREWKDAFAGAGFRVVRRVEFVPRISARLAAKAAVSALPGPVRRRAVQLPVPPAFAWAWARTRVSPRAEAVGSVVFAPTRSTGILAERIG